MLVKFVSARKMCLLIKQERTTRPENIFLDGPSCFCDIFSLYTMKMCGIYNTNSIFLLVFAFMKTSIITQCWHGLLICFIVRIALSRVLHPVSIQNCSKFDQINHFYYISHDTFKLISISKLGRWSICRLQYTRSCNQYG